MDAKVAEAARALPAGSMVVVVVTPGETLELGTKILMLERK